MGSPVTDLCRKGDTGFEPVLPEKGSGKANSCNTPPIGTGSDVNPHLRAVLERLKERENERRG